MKVTLLICSQTALLDQQSNALSVINIVQEISSPVFPFAIPGFTIASILVKEDSEPESPDNIHVRMMLNGKQTMDVPLVVNFQGRLITRHIGAIQGLLIGEPGDMVIGFYEDDRELGRWEILVRHIGQPQMKTETSPLQ